LELKVFKKIALCAGIAALAPFFNIASAQDYPAKAIRTVLPFAAGGPTDAIGRVIATQMGTLLGQPLFIETKPGASGTLGAAEVARAKADGYTLLMNASVQVTYPGLFKSLSFDPMKDFEFIGVLGTVPMVAVVPPNSRFKKFSDIVKAAKEAPQSVSYASPGVATIPHLVGELVSIENKAPMTHAGYKGTAPALTDIAGGHVDLFYAPLAPAMPLIKSGKIKALAVTTKDRIAELPDVPTISSELSPSNFNVVTWYGLWAPKGTPRPILEKLNQALLAASKSDKVLETLKAQGTVPSTMNLEQANRFANEENKKWVEVMKAANIQPE
jgi:tripartite-type tricarboxylate transporter receptor subunit TctC